MAENNNDTAKRWLPANIRAWLGDVAKGEFGSFMRKTNTNDGTSARFATDTINVVSKTVNLANAIDGTPALTYTGRQVMTQQGLAPEVAMRSVRDGNITPGEITEYNRTHGTQITAPQTSQSVQGFVSGQVKAAIRDLREVTRDYNQDGVINGPEYNTAKFVLPALKTAKNER